MKSFKANFKNDKANFNDDWILVEAGKFQGDMGRVQENIEKFFQSHKVSYSSLGHGYGELHIDNKMLDVNPYGIDVDMLDKFLWQDFHVDITGNHTEDVSE